MRSKQASCRKASSNGTNPEGFAAGKGVVTRHRRRKEVSIVIASVTEEVVEGKESQARNTPR